jgi:hypothetical protein
VAAGLAVPHAAQAIGAARRIWPVSGKWRTLTIYALASLTASRASPSQLAGWIPGHWAADALHHICAITNGGDSSQARTGGASPRLFQADQSPASWFGGGWLVRGWSGRVPRLRPGRRRSATGPVPRGMRRRP